MKLAEQIRNDKEQPYKWYVDKIKFAQNNGRRNIEIDCSNESPEPLIEYFSKEGFVCSLKTEKKTRFHPGRREPRKFMCFNYYEFVFGEEYEEKLLTIRW